MNPESEVEVLLIEDNPADVELTLRALKKRNLANKVHVVSDGAQALEFLLQEPEKGQASHPPKVVFLDLKLPRVDGHEVLRKLKSDPRTRAIPVVILTSSK
ncbi:MAG: response regulator, partial [Candidatus Aminicenantes bacterium]|nr:response regulator [Candidatus Aminicenantes bacterium]